MKKWSVRLAAGAVLAILCISSAAVAVAAEPIKPKVTVTLATTSGLKKVKAGGMLPSELKALLKKYTLKGAPKTLTFFERDSSYTVKTGDLALKPNIANLVKLASIADTGTAVGGPYVSAAAEKKLTARIAAVAKKMFVKTKTVKPAGGGKLKNFGGRTLDQKKALKAVAKALNKYGTSKTKKLSALEAPIVLSKPQMTGRDGKGKVLVASLTQRVVYLFKANKLVAQYGICIGMSAYKTPTGNYRVARKKKNPTWNNPGAAWSKGMAESISGAGGPLGKAALYLTLNGKDIGIRFHGTAKTWSIGHAYSHGCMRLANANILKLYNQVPVGTMATVVK